MHFESDLVVHGNLEPTRKCFCKPALSVSETLEPRDASTPIPGVAETTTALLVRLCFEGVAQISLRFHMCSRVGRLCQPPEKSPDVLGFLQTWSIGTLREISKSKATRSHSSSLSWAPAPACIQAAQGRQFWDPRLSSRHEPWRQKGRRVHFEKDGK